MRTHRMRFATTALILALPALIATDCKKQPVDEGNDGADHIGAQDIDVELRVVALSPRYGDENVSFPATLRGSAFATGAVVQLGAIEPSDVMVLNGNTLTFTVPQLPSGDYDVTVRNPDGGSSTLRSGLTISSAKVACDDATVRFALDASSLDGGATRTLQTNLTCWRESDAPMRIEGHCDERGTTDYNLALGHRRANAVSRWLVSQGVPPSRIDTTSYGEEQPADRSSGEAAWAHNRRAEIKIQD